MYVSAVNMSKSCCFALLLAVICPSTQVQADHCDAKQALVSALVCEYLIDLVLLANVLSPVRLSVCRMSETFVRPTQAVQIFGNISTALGTMAMH